MTTPEKKPLYEYIPTWLPVAICLVSAIGFAVRADGDIKEIQIKTQQYDRMMLDRTDRMARIETKLDNQEKTLLRIEERLSAR